MTKLNAYLIVVGATQFLLNRD